MPTFDAYYKWLGIPPAESAIGVLNHYRLLGVSLFEADAEAIASAADQRMAHLRTLQTGPHSNLSQKLLNQVANAKLCLLAPDRKAAYDTELRRSLESSPLRLTSVADGRSQPRTPLRIAGRLDTPSTAADSAARRNAIELESLGFDPTIQRAGKTPRSRAKLGTGPMAFWAPLAAVTALLLAIWIASESDNGLSPVVAAKNGGETRQPRAVEHSDQRSNHAKAAGNIQHRRDPSVPSSGIGEDPDSAPVQPRNDLPTTTAQAERIPAALESRGTSAAGPAATQSRAKIDRTSPFTAPYSDGYKSPRNAARGKPAPLPDNAFVVSLAKDSAGRVWIGTEDLGVFRFDPSAAGGSQWTEFTTRDGLGDDNVYALCVDRLNRVWVGHLNHGVSVYNGQSWVNYDVLDGPIGERVFSIAADPVSGDVWIATSAGLSRYSLEKDNWTHYTRDDGLPSDQIQSLAFDSRGTLYAGTQCEGLAIADAAHDYRRWRQITGSDALSLVSAGSGLPSNLINDVLVARSGVVFVATTCGLAASKDHGKSWAFIRGKDWGAKVKGLYGGPPRGWREGPAQFLLTEDYCTRLAEDDSGLLWIGHRQTGYEAIDPATLQRRFDSRSKGPGTRVQSTGEVTKNKDDKEKSPPDYVTALLCVAGNEPLVGCYGNGICPLFAADNSPAKTQGAAATISPARLPAPAGPPTLDELNSLLARLAAVPMLRRVSSTVVQLPDDWRTHGDWLGRYGRYYACCCAICSPDDYEWGAGPEPVQRYARIGPNYSEAGDTIRYWVHWLQTGDPRSLEMPPTYLDSRIKKGFNTLKENRRQAEWDDHGEAYPYTLDGPDIYCTLTIPSGQFYLSLYEFNKDGHEAGNRLRDYRVSVRPHATSLSLDRIDDFSGEVELARARIRNFWGGVWKRFYVEGPLDVTIRICKNGSLNALLAGVMLDSVDERPVPYFCSDLEWNNRTAKLRETRDALLSEPSSARAGRFRPDSNLAAAADRLLEGLERTSMTNAPWWSAESRPFYVALARSYRRPEVPGVSTSDHRRHALGPERSNARLATCYYQLGLFAQWENLQRADKLRPARDIEKALRWDGVVYSNQRRGHYLVSEYLKGDKK